MACFWRHGTKLMLVSIAAAAGSGKFTPDPIMAYVSTGVFSISNYDPTLTYTAALVGGSGTATLNASNGRYTLSSANARFSVIARLSINSPASNPDFMERKSYTYSCRQVPRTETYYDQPCYLDAGCGGCKSGPGQCAPGQTQSFGQCGCPGYMCWNYYNGVVCTQYTRTVYDTYCDVLVNQPGYTNSGTEWYKVS